MHFSVSPNNKGEQKQGLRKKYNLAEGKSRITETINFPAIANTQKLNTTATKTLIRRQAGKLYASGKTAGSFMTSQKPARIFIAACCPKKSS